MTCCGHGKALANIAKGNISLLLSTAFRLPPSPAVAGRHKTCLACPEATWYTKGEYARWLTANLPDVAANLPDLTTLPPLEKRSDGNLLCCRLCKCWLPAKVRVTSEKCPLGKW